jgi:hypothetical protein
MEDEPLAVGTLFDLAASLGEKFPFVVRKERWDPIFGLCVVGIRTDAEQLDKRRVVSFGLSPLNGKPVNQYWGTFETPCINPVPMFKGWELVEPSEVDAMWLSEIAAACAVALDELVIHGSEGEYRVRERVSGSLAL